MGVVAPSPAAPRDGGARLGVGRSRVCVCLKTILEKWVSRDAPSPNTHIRSALASGLSSVCMRRYTLKTER